ncbi:GrpB family protein [Kutzneria chonburiensis]|uniref:GrpB family protein n=1 Tax=Kutzneria chonburiensis TaxID=1483604 RepID=A0ABV6MSD6_9PSEU|nr:GrpB family protein [Kutzneria chonburiensis]
MISIVAYNPRWPAVFASLRDGLVGPLRGLASHIEHVGSTAVPGLAAKDVIDLTAVVPSLDHLPAVIGRLAPLGYSHEGDLGVTGRHAFTTPAGAPAHHLYVCAHDNPDFARVLAFRDYLRTHPDTARAYAELKYFLADRFRDDRAGYTAAKSAFISRIVTTAMDAGDS